MDDPILEAIDAAFRDTLVPAKQTAARLQRAIEHCRTLLNVLMQQRGDRPPAFDNDTASTAGTNHDADKSSLAMHQY